MWVPAGVYDGVREYWWGAVRLASGVHLYGGFTGTETRRAERDWASNETVIDGASADDGDAACHVLVGANVSTLDGFIVRGGSIPENGLNAQGAGLYNWHASPTLANCTFLDNASGNGGGMYNHESMPTLMNCTFWSNTASKNGGGMYNYGSTLTLMNCTFSNNTAEYGLIIYNNRSIFFATNCIMLETSTLDISDGYGSSKATYSCLRSCWSGEGNIDEEPLFVDAANGDLRLLAGSPCIDMGTLEGVPDVDIDGVPRPQGTGVDMGAYEYIPGEYED